MNVRAALSAWVPPPRFLAVGAFLFAGDMKAGALLARVPVDLTLLTGSILTCVLVREWLRGARTTSRAGLLLTGLWYLSFLPGALGAAGTAYAFQKVATIFTFSLLASLAPFVLVREDRDLDRLLAAVALFSLLIAVDGLLGAGHGLERLQGAGGGTISLGRSAGYVLLFGFLRLSRPGPLPLFTLAATAAGAVAALFSGSRGPMGGAAAALALVFLAGRGATRRFRLRSVLAATGVALALGCSMALAPRGSLRRTESFLKGEFGMSEQYRAAAARASLARLGGAPWGVGWGGFAVVVDLDCGTGRQYPHNLLLEVALESGWLCGAATLLVLGAGLGAAWARSAGPEGGILFAGLAFWIINALVSGDLNDNRPLFAFLSASLCRWHPAVRGEEAA